MQGAELQFAADLDAAMPLASDVEVLFGAPDLLVELLPQAAQLRWVQSSWAGVTPLLQAPRRDYLLTGVKDIFGQPMAEYVLGWLLALERQIPRRFAATHWDDRPDGSIAGKTVGIMGTGSIGEAVAHACSALGLSTRGLNSDGRTVAGFDACWPMSDKLGFAADLDYLVALLPDTPATDHAVDVSLLDAMKRGGIVINGGRGNAVDTPAVVEALASGQLSHAVLDVLPEEPLPDDDPLWQIKGLSITSHTAAPTPASAIIGIFRENFDRYRDGQPLHYVIDFERGY